MERDENIDPDTGAYGERSLLVFSHCLFTHIGTFLLFIPVDLVINVNIQHPERNIIGLVVPFTNVEEQGCLHDGFEILIKGDLTDFAVDAYKAHVLNKREVLITMPAASQSYLRHYQGMYEVLKTAGEIVCQQSEQAHAITRNAILGDTSRNTMRILLRFPTDVVLTTEYYADTTDGELECDMVNFESMHEVGGRIVSRWNDMVLWKVALHENPKRQVEEAQTPGKPKGMAKLEAKMQRMQMGQHQNSA